MHTLKKYSLLSLFVFLTLFLITTLTYVVTKPSSSTHIATNVHLEKYNVGKMEVSQLDEIYQSLESTIGKRTVVITGPIGEQTVTLEELGFALEKEEMTSRLLDTSRRGNAFQQFFSWIGSYFSPPKLPVLYSFSNQKITEVLHPLISANTQEAIEPSLVPDKEHIGVSDGQAGYTLDIEQIHTQLTLHDYGKELDNETPITLETERVEIQPKFSRADAEALAYQAELLTNEPITLQVNTKTISIDPTTIRSWILSTPTDTKLELVLDEEKVSEDVAEKTATLDSLPRDAGFIVKEDNTIEITDAVEGQKCCEQGSSQKIISAITEGKREISLKTVPYKTDHDRVWAEKLQIKEPVATFTTKHPAGEPRVKNIHRIADIIDNKVIPPGETFSLNEAAGKRTREKGFVEAPVIYNGKLDSDVGGGVSQFATTLFNTAFFAGLKIPEYQAHTLYISRYPYGREATVSWPAPDLKITNTSPYGILIKTSYTETSITVTFYSTLWAIGEQTNQSKSTSGACTKVTTQRTVTFLSDQHQTVDNFFVLYQPKDGVTC